MIEQAGVLLGELQKDSEEKCVFVKGVIKSVVEDKGERIRFDENVWNRIYSDTEKYFPNLSVVGWFAVVPDLTSERMARLKKIHLKMEVLENRKGMCVSMSGIMKCRNICLNAMERNPVRIPGLIRLCRQ